MELQKSISFSIVSIDSNFFGKVLAQILFLIGKENHLNIY